MNTTLELTMRPRLEQGPYPELVAFVQALGLSTAEFEEEVERALTENPALERVEARRHLAGQPGYSTGPTRGDPVEYLAARSSWREELTASARLSCSNEDAPAVEFIVGSLDEHGFLTADPEDIAHAARARLEAVGRALEAVQRAGPPGIALRDARESLLAQLEALEPAGDIERLARSIVSDHLAALARGSFGTIATALGVSREDVLAARGFISSRLRPWPVPPVEGVEEPRDSMLADLIVTKRQSEPGRLHVELAEAASFRLSVSPLWERTLRENQFANALERRCVRSQVLQARSFVSRIRRREKTLLAVTRRVVERQQDYILRGPRFLRPLTRAEIARELGMHDSTVGRAVAGKHALLPSGRLVPLADLLDPATGAREELARLVAAEPRPLSDGDLAQELGRLGLPVARRTVAKYRTRLGIPPKALR